MRNTLPSQNWKPYFLLPSTCPVPASNPLRQQQAYKQIRSTNGKLPPTTYRRRRQTDCFSSLWRMNRRGWSWQKRFYHKERNPALKGRVPAIFVGIHIRNPSKSAVSYIRGNPRSAQRARMGFRFTINIIIKNVPRAALCI